MTEPVAEAESLFTFATARLIREGATKYGERWNEYKDRWEAAIRADERAKRQELTEDAPVELTTL